MTRGSLLARLLKKKRSSVRSTERRRQRFVRRKRLTIEALEPRALLTLIGVNSLADGPVNLADGDITLRDALALAADEANYPGADEITFDASLGLQSTPGRITLTAGQLTIHSDVAVSGPGADSLSIDADGQSRVFYVEEAVTAGISGVTITGGDVDGQEGGGVSNYGTLTLVNCTIVANSGGGIVNGSESGSLTVTNCTIVANSGHGIVNESKSGRLTVANSAIVANSWHGIWNETGSGSLTVTNCTLVASGLLAAIVSRDTLTFANSILWGHPGDGGDQIEPWFDWSVGDGNLIDKPWFGWAGGGNLIGIDPHFVRNPSDGGDGWGDDPWTEGVDESANDDYGDLHLTDRSIAIGYGDNSLMPPDAQDWDQDGVTDEPIPYDRDGAARVHGTVVDCGAFEFQGEAPAREMPAVVVTTASDVFDPFDDDTTLREAIFYAGTADLGTTVTFDAALDGATITLGGSFLLLDKSLTIDASALHSLTVDADENGSAFRVVGSAVVLDSLTITGSHTGYLGGILNWGTLTVENCTLTDNSYAGLVNSSGAVAVVRNSVFSHNAGDGTVNYGTLTLFNSVIAANSGAGILNESESSSLTVTNCTLAANDGGAILS